MQTRKLGHSKLEVSALGLGCMSMTGGYSRSPWIVPIPGTRRLERLDENLGSASLELTADDLRDIRPPAAVNGTTARQHCSRTASPQPES